MADPVSGAIIASAIIGAGSTVYQSEEMKRQARIARDRQDEAIRAQEAELKGRQEEEQKSQTRDVSRAEKKSKSLLAGGRQSTLLTSPLGVVQKDEQQQMATKSLLGM